jgi:hypothetical protein
LPAFALRRNQRSANFTMMSLNAENARNFNDRCARLNLARLLR